MSMAFHYMEHSLTLAITLTLATSACQRGIPCTDCDGGGADMSEETVVPDLPCGGADLMTDLDNCGTCGNTCPVWRRGTEYETGSCQSGVCVGPGWDHCVSELVAGDTCAEICGLGGSTAMCMPGGCAGYTALLIYADSLDPNCERDPYATMSGACDEPIPWGDPLGEGGSVYAICCCG